MQKRATSVIMLGLGCGILFSTPALTEEEQTKNFGEFSGNIEFEQRYFYDEPLLPWQKDSFSSFAGDVKYNYSPNDNKDYITIRPFYRYDNTDKDRSHFDLREANILHNADNFNVRAGIGQVFWGKTESINLVNIINQTDFVEEIDSRQKLGQPMLEAEYTGEYGTITGYVLPYFRERTFPSSKGRFSIPRLGDARYESGAGENHVDYALRYNNTYGDFSYAISHFYGTSRDPRFIVDPVNFEIDPYYDIIHQTGLEGQYTKGDLTLKLEVIDRAGDNIDDFIAYTAGAEYVMYNIFSDADEVRLFAEYLHDERGDLSPQVLFTGDYPSLFEDDMFFGARIGFNDARNSVLQGGVFYDVSSGSYINSLEYQVDIAENLRAFLQSRIFYDDSVNGLNQIPDPLAAIENDDYVQLKIKYYF